MKKLFFTLCALCLCGTMWGLTNDSRYLCDADRPTNESGEIYEDANGSGLSFYISAGSNYVTAGSAVITYINDADLNTNNPYNDSNWTTGYNLSGTLTIPETVKDDEGNEYVVAHIGAYAFYKTGITGELTIPACINELGRSAFESCTGITSVTLEYSATALQEENGVATANSFYGCSGIEEVRLNRDVNDGRSSSSSNYAYLDAPFSYLTSIKTIYVGEEVTKIPYNMFNCNTETCALTTVYCYATNHVPSLDFRSFGQHTDLTLYVYDELVETFAADHQTYTDNYNNTSGGWGDVFSNIQGMGEIPTTLEDGTYKDTATGLYFEVDEDTGVISIYHDEAGVYTDANLVVYSVDEEGNATAYTLPSTVDDGDGHSGNVTRIEANAFESSSISGHIVIPAYISAIGAEAFKSCTQITEVTYEYSATEMSDENDGNSTGYTFTSCSGITKVNIYRDITIGSSSRVCAPFAWQTAIETINIGPRVTELPNYMFRQTSNNPIATINCYGAVPPTLGTGVFDNLGSTYTINVPQGSLSTYQTSWSTYSNFVEMENAYAVNIHNVDADGDGYATFYDSKAVKLYGDVVAYTVSGVEVDEETNNAYVLMQELGDVIPAGTGALLSGDVAYYTAIEETAVSGETYSGTDYLLGFDDDNQTTVAPNNGSADDYYFYMLTLDSNNDSGSLAFYWGATDGAPFTCSAHKAYLALEKGVVGTNNVKLKKGEGEDTTGISSVESTVEGATVKGIYTIQGVRVSNMNQPGLYIVDGKKVLKR